MYFIFVCVICIIMNEDYLRVVSGHSPPSRPNHVTLLADTNNIGIQWDPPTYTYGNIRKYIVSWSILPNFTDVSTLNIVDDRVTMTIVPVQGNIGRLFRIRVRAENDAGIGAYSDPHYVRIGCGEVVELMPYTNKTVTSPGFNKHPLAPGVICKWTIKTREKFVLSFAFKTLSLISKNTVNNLQEASEQNKSCAQTFVNITDVSSVRQFCNNSREKIIVFSETSIVDITLITGSLAGGRGFSLVARSVPKLPGSPTNIIIWTNERAIKVSWQPPIESTLPITSYRIQYKVVPTGSDISVAVGASMRTFTINSQAFQGKVVRLSITAMIGGEEGQRSRSLYARAACRHRVQVLQGNSVNITSPNYPRAYPSSIVCTWDINTSPGATFHVTYVDFRLEDTPFCSSDYVTFSSFPNPELVCARMELPKTVAIDTENFTLTFVTDNKQQFQGFLIEVRSIVSATPSSPHASSSSGVTISSVTPMALTTSKTPSSDEQSTEISATTPSASSTNIAASGRLINIPTPGHLTNIQTSGHHINIPTSGHLTYTQSSGHLVRTRTPSAAVITSSPDRDINSPVVYHDPVTQATIHQLKNNTSTAKPVHSVPSTREKTNNYLLKSVETSPTITESTGLVRFIDKSRPRTESRITGSTGLVQFLNLSRHRTEMTSSSPISNRNDQQANDTLSTSPPDSHSLVTPVVVCVAVVMVVAIVGLVAFCRRRWRRRVKINCERSDKYRQTTIELHDIVPQVRRHHQTNIFTAHVPLPAQVRAHHQTNSFTAHVPLPAIEEEQEQATVMASLYTGDKGRRRKTGKKYNSFPSRYCDKKKVHGEVERAMKAFSFIEDQHSLERHIRRKHIRRTNSM